MNSAQLFSSDWTEAMRTDPVTIHGSPEAPIAIFADSHARFLMLKYTHSNLRDAILPTFVRSQSGKCAREVFQYASTHPNNHLPKKIVGILVGINDASAFLEDEFESNMSDFRPKMLQFMAQLIDTFESFLLAHSEKYQFAVIFGMFKRYKQGAVQRKSELPVETHNDQLMQVAHAQNWKFLSLGDWHEYHMDQRGLHLRYQPPKTSSRRSGARPCWNFATKVMRKF